MTTESASRVFAGDGRVLTLDRTLNSGGAGSIHRIVEIPDLVAKLYHPQVNRPIYERKVEAMVRLVPDLPDIPAGGGHEVQIAWPRFLLRDRQRRFVGFAMPLLDLTASVELEYVLQERQARAQGLPTGLGAKVTLAANVASLTAELHRQGHYVVDLKPVNLRFYRRSLHVAMLDCDGCSIKGEGERFPATQFTPDYLAPEFQVQGLSVGGDQASNEESQDRFALAVVVFQLLNFGIHPFTGRPTSEWIPTDIPGRIAHRCYAYGLRPHPEMAPNLASGHTAMPMELRLLFDRAFTAIGVARPSADDWVGHLRAYGRRSTGMLVPCRVNAAHQHFAGYPCAACARAALLTRAASVVRPPVGKAPQWSAPQWAALRWTARRARPPSAFTAPTPPPPVPSFIPNPWKGVAFLVPLLVPLFFFICSETSRSRKASPSATETTQQWPVLETPTKPTVDAILGVAGSSDIKTISQLLYGLPSMEGQQDPDECRAAAASWRQKVQWIKDDPAFARDSYLSSSEQRPGPCDDLYTLASRIVRTLELCRARLHSPGGYPGIGEAECRSNRVIEAGVDTLKRAIVYAVAEESPAWDFLAEAFVLTDDYSNAVAAYIVSTLLARRIADERRLWTVIDEQWLFDRAQILAARAYAKVSSWINKPVPDEIKETLDAPWPDEPPPKKPRHRRPRN